MWLPPGTGRFFKASCQCTWKKRCQNISQVQQGTWLGEAGFLIIGTVLLFPFTDLAGSMLPSHVQRKQVVMKYPSSRLLETLPVLYLDQHEGFSLHV